MEFNRLNFKQFLCLVEFRDVKKITPLDFDHQGNIDEFHV